MSHGVSSQHSSQSQEALEQRRQIALHVAAESDRLLRDQFGATGVTVFGSLAGQSPWHWDSDIDLAVEGLSFEQWLAAVDAVRAIAPDWLSVDVVRLETLNPAVRYRVLQQHHMTQNKFLALKDHLDDEVRALDETTAAMIWALAQVPNVPEDFDIRTLATYINDFYRCCERMSKRVAVAMDGGLYQGDVKHQALLRQVAEPGKNNRPPLWSGALLFDLDEYRRFRHVVHHKYGDELHPDYVLKLAELAPQVTPKVKEAIARFKEWLTTQASNSTSE